jgi:hypothetical protein
MIALNDREPLDQVKGTAFLKRTLPGIPDLEVVGQEDDLIVYRTGGAVATMILMPAPIPWSDLEGPCATAWYWRDATRMMKTHVAHVIVTLHGGGGDILARHLLLTQFVAAAVATTNCAGVYWGSGMVVNSPKEFIKRSKRMTGHRPPLVLWISLRLQRMSKDTWRLFITGLSAFKQMELEAPAAKVEPMTVFNLAHGLATYMLTSGKTLKDGDTFGGPETERVRVTYGPSTRDKSRTVMRLEF